MSILLDTGGSTCYLHAWCLCGRFFLLRCDSLNEAIAMRRKLRDEQCTGCSRNWSMFAIRSSA
jgi:hypothetical protein